MSCTVKRACHGSFCGAATWIFMNSHDKGIWNGTSQTGTKISRRNKRNNYIYNRMLYIYTCWYKIYGHETVCATFSLFLSTYLFSKYEHVLSHAYMIIESNIYIYHKWLLKNHDARTRLMLRIHLSNIILKPGNIAYKIYLRQIFPAWPKISY